MKDGIEVSAPAPIAGHMEVRGLGIVSVTHVQSAMLGLVVRLTEAANIERLPELDKSSFEIFGKTFRSFMSIPIPPRRRPESAPRRWLLRV